MGAVVLVVGKQPELLQVFEQAGRLRGLTVKISMDGPSALDIIRRGPPDLIVADYHMSGTSLVAFCERLAGLDIQPIPPIIGLVNPSERIDEQELRYLGVKALLPKPVQIEAVHAQFDQMGLGAGPPAPAASAPLSSAGQPAGSGGPDGRETILRLLDQELPARMAAALPREDFVLIAMEAVQQSLPDISAQVMADLKPAIQRQVADAIGPAVKQAVEAALREHGLLPK